MDTLGSSFPEVYDSGVDGPGPQIVRIARRDRLVQPIGDSVQIVPEEARVHVHVIEAEACPSIR